MIQAYMRLLLSLGAAHRTDQSHYAAMGIPTVTVWRLITVHVYLQFHNLFPLLPLPPICSNH